MPDFSDFISTSGGGTSIWKKKLWSLDEDTHDDTVIKNTQLKATFVAGHDNLPNSRA